MEKLIKFFNVIAGLLLLAGAAWGQVDFSQIPSSIQNSGGIVEVVDGTGATNATPASGQDHTVTVAGGGEITLTGGVIKLGAPLGSNTATVNIAHGAVSNQTMRLEVDNDAVTVVFVLQDENDRSDQFSLISQGGGTGTPIDMLLTGEATIGGLATTGAAGTSGTGVVCVDGNGKLYASTSTTDCQD